jgi:hypothetical protein
MFIYSKKLLDILIFAFGDFFCLETKETKIQDCEIIKYKNCNLFSFKKNVGCILNYSIIKS